MSAQEPFRIEIGHREKPRAYTISFHGQHSMQRTNHHSNPVLDEILKGRFQVVMFDYSDAIFGHSIPDFTTIANAWCDRLPAGMIFTYQFAPASMTHAMLMSRLMKERGMIAGAFPSEEHAVAFIQDNLSD